MLVHKVVIERIHVRAHRTKPIFRFRYFCPIAHLRARRKSFLKMFAAKTDFPAVFADDSKFSSFVRKKSVIPLGYR